MPKQTPARNSRTPDHQWWADQAWAAAKRLGHLNRPRSEFVLMLMDISRDRARLQATNL